MTSAAAAPNIGLSDENAVPGSRDRGGRALGHRGRARGRRSAGNRCPPYRYRGRLRQRRGRRPGHRRLRYPTCRDLPHHQTGYRGPRVPGLPGCRASQPGAPGPGVRRTSISSTGPAVRAESMWIPRGGLMRVQGDGHAKSIGVANFTPEHLSTIIDLTYVVPTVNQVELRPQLVQTELQCGARRARHRHPGLQPAARRRQAAGEPDGHLRRRRVRQDTRPGADPLEPAAEQFGRVPFDLRGTHQRKKTFRRVRLRTCRGASGGVDRSR